MRFFPTFILSSICLGVSTVPTTTDSPHPDFLHHRDKLIGSYAFPIAQRLSFSKAKNIFTEDLHVAQVIHDSSNLGAEFLRYCDGPRSNSNFYRVLRDIKAVTRFINAELAKPPVGVRIDGLAEEELAKIMLDAKLERLLEFEIAASFFWKLSQDMLNCSCKLNPYATALFRLRIATISFRFDFEATTDEQVRSIVDDLSFEVNSWEREKLVLSAIADMIKPLFHPDLFVYLVQYDWNACKISDSAACDVEDDRKVKILNYLYSQSFASAAVSDYKTMLNTAVVSLERRNFYEELAAEIIAAQSYSLYEQKMKDYFGEFVMELFNTRGEFFDYGAAAFANLLNRKVDFNTDGDILTFGPNKQQLIRNMNDLNVIAANRGMGYALGRNIAGPVVFYERARDVVLNCIESPECDAAKEITAEIIVDILLLPPSIDLAELENVLRTDCYSKRLIRVGKLIFDEIAETHF